MPDALFPVSVLRAVYLGIVLMITGGTQCPAASRHPISVTETSVFVTHTRAVARVQFFAEDLVLFHGLEPDASDSYSKADLTRGLDLHRAFLSEKFTLRNSIGEKISGSIVNVKPFEIPDNGLASVDLMLHSATIEFEYLFETPPEFITIQQDITDSNALFPSDMKLSVHQTGTDLTYTDSLKPGSAVTLRFDWSSDPISEDASEEEFEKWFQAQREATLGITSYSSTYSFIYIEPAEVRHEILIPIASLNAFLPLQHRDPAFIDVDEQDAVRTLIREWLTGKNPVRINGQLVSPEWTRMDFYGLDLRDFATQAEARRTSLANGRVGIMITWRLPEQIVREVEMTWDVFNSHVKKVESVVIAGKAPASKFEFSRYNEPADNILRWTCPPEEIPVPSQNIPVQVEEKPELRIPVLWLTLMVLYCLTVAYRIRCGNSTSARGRRIAFGMIGALLLSCGVLFSNVPGGSWTFPHPWKSPPDVPEEAAVRIFRELHSGMYRALDFGTESQIYDALKFSATGNLLHDIYLQLRQSLEMREQGGAVARVRSVEHVETRRMPQSEVTPKWPGFEVESTWTVSGTVEHWGHVHERQNQFSAIFSIEPEDGHWRLTSMSINDERQISKKTTLRDF